MSAEKERAEPMPVDEALTVISLALLVVALNQSRAEAANADERKRYDDATQKSTNLLLARIEKL